MGVVSTRRLSCHCSTKNSDQWQKWVASDIVVVTDQAHAPRVLLTAFVRLRKLRRLIRELVF